MLCLDFPQAGLKWFNTQVLIHFQRKYKVIATVLRKITFINKWLSYLGSGHPVRLGGIRGCLHSLRGYNPTNPLAVSHEILSLFLLYFRKGFRKYQMPPHGPSARDSKFLQEAIFLPLSLRTSH